MFLEATWKGKLHQCLASFSGAIAMMSCGINASWGNPYYSYLLSNTSTIYTTEQTIFWCSSTPYVGSIFGAILAANIVDRWGRKITILTVAPLTFFSFITMALAKNIWLITLPRLAIGISNGVLSTAMPMYIGESVDPTIRGFLAATLTTFFIAGTLVINIIGPVMDIFTSCMISVTIPTFHFLVFIFMPESPYWLIKSKNYHEAWQALKVLKGMETVSKELENVHKAVSRQEQMIEVPKFINLFILPSNRKACYIYLILATTNKMSDKVAVMMYTTMMFQKTGNANVASISLISYNALELIIVALTTFFVIDRFGKRFLLITSAAGCGISVFFLAIYFFLEDHHLAVIGDHNLHWLLTILVSYNVLFSIGLGFAPYTYLSELFPMDVKANALCCAEIIVVVSGIISSKFFEAIYKQAGTLALPFFCFSIGCWIGLIFILRDVPETKRKTLEEIQQYLIAEQESRSICQNRYCIFCKRV